jgi:hypothetical protein
MALLISFVPTFMKEQAPKELKILEDDRPELDEKSGVKKSDQKNFFIFIVDRSGSMMGETIKTTVEALKLFIQSLPPGCAFDIISFGSSYISMT